MASIKYEELFKSRDFSESACNYSPEQEQEQRLATLKMHFIAGQSILLRNIASLDQAVKGRLDDTNEILEYVFKVLDCKTLNGRTLDEFKEAFEKAVIVEESCDLPEDLKESTYKVEEIKSKRFDIEGYNKLLDEIADGIYSETGVQISKKKEAVYKDLSERVESLKNEYQNVLYKYAEQVKKQNELNKELKEELSRLATGLSTSINNTNITNIDTTSSEMLSKSLNKSDNSGETTKIEVEEESLYIPNGLTIPLVISCLLCIVCFVVSRQIKQ